MCRGCEEYDKEHGACMLEGGPCTEAQDKYEENEFDRMVEEAIINSTEV